MYLTLLMIYDENPNHILTDTLMDARQKMLLFPSSSRKLVFHSFLTRFICLQLQLQLQFTFLFSSSFLFFYFLLMLFCVLFNKTFYVLCPFVLF